MGCLFMGYEREIIYKENAESCIQVNKQMKLIRICLHFYQMLMYSHILHIPQAVYTNRPLDFTDLPESQFNQFKY